MTHSLFGEHKAVLLWAGGRPMSSEIFENGIRRRVAAFAMWKRLGGDRPVRKITADFVAAMGHLKAALEKGSESFRFVVVVSAIHRCHGATSAGLLYLVRSTS